jgi:hypothetical protein
MVLNITRKNRREAYNKIIPKRDNRKGLILSVLKEHPDGMTAEEVVQALVDNGKISHMDMNFVRPRLTELKESGMVQVIGRRPSAITGRNTAVWKVVPC